MYARKLGAALSWTSCATSVQAHQSSSQIGLPSAPCVRYLAGASDERLGRSPSAPAKVTTVVPNAVSIVLQSDAVHPTTSAPFGE